jgi:hypothetical protein
MNRSESLIAARIYFLERELERMSCAADNAEDELRARPMDAAAVRRLEALYTLADETWERIQALRVRLSGGPSVIYFNPRLAGPAAKAWRQALV